MWTDKMLYLLPECISSKSMSTCSFCSSFSKVLCGPLLPSLVRAGEKTQTHSARQAAAYFWAMYPHTQPQAYYLRQYDNEKHVGLFQGTASSIWYLDQVTHLKSGPELAMEVLTGDNRGHVTTEDRSVTALTGPRMLQSINRHQAFFRKQDVRDSLNLF